MTQPAQTPSGPLPKPNDRCWCGSGKKYKRCHQPTDEAGPSRAPVGRRLVLPGKISPMRKVPDHIVRPEYAITGKPAPATGSEIKTPEQIARMRRACKAAAQTLEKLGKLVRPGITTEELDAVAHEEAISRGAYPSTLNYHGYPKSLCTSVNEVICHGIPDSRALEEGDIVNLDVTLYLDGMHGDCSATYLVGKVDEAARKLVETTYECMMKGIAAVKPGRPISDIGRAIQTLADQHGYGVVRAYCGHGIGERFHTGLQIPHYFEEEATTRMAPGMIFTVEPMITVGSWDYDQWKDGWTAVTADRSLTAQFEHTVLVTESGAEILTLP
jgi:methionyl aminopeptidase